MKTQRFILAAGCGLAFGAAFANAGMVLKTGTSVSHLTGDISRLSLDLFAPSPAISSEITRIATAFLFFVFGTFAAGLLIHHPTLDFSRPYGRTITGIGLLFLAAFAIIPHSPVAGIALAALACGLQNALATRYRGLILRTTHLTGLTTDFGITLGMRVRGFDIPTWKIAVPALLMTSFFLGGLSACAVSFFSSVDPILIAGIGYISAGLLWTIVKQIVRSRAAQNET